jgi:hypothetical protein
VCAATDPLAVVAEIVPVNASITKANFLIRFLQRKFLTMTTTKISDASKIENLTPIQRAVLDAFTPEHRGHDRVTIAVYLTGCAPPPRRIYAAMKRVADLTLQDLVELGLFWRDVAGWHWLATDDPDTPSDQLQTAGSEAQPNDHPGSPSAAAT